jgi:hypothetical protein
VSLTACLQYTKGIVDGLQSPQLNPLRAVVQPPVLSDIAAQPWAFIWAARSPIDRQTAPRVIRQPGGGVLPGGYQKAKWTIPIRLYTIMAQDDPNIETAFPGLIDAVILAVTTTPIAIIETDPLTGQQFQILMFGEHLDVDYASATAQTNGQSIIRFACDLEVRLEEKLAPSEGLAG